MSKTWIRAKLPEFVRDMFRNFCMSSKALEQQFVSFDREGAVAFTILRDLIGQEMDKGLLWRMKDTAHHVFRNDPETPLTGQFLDWGLGPRPLALSAVRHRCRATVESLPPVKATTVCSGVRPGTASSASSTRRARTIFSSRGEPGRRGGSTERGSRALVTA